MSDELKRVSSPSQDHFGVYITWGADPRPYCKGSYRGRLIQIPVSPDLAADPIARRYVEDAMIRQFAEFFRDESDQ